MESTTYNKGIYQMLSQRVTSLRLLVCVLLVISVQAGVTSPRYTGDNDHPSGSYLLEGDIRDENPWRQDKDGTSDISSGKWPDGIVPYVMQDDYPEWLKMLIELAITEVESQVIGAATGNENWARPLPLQHCVRFIPRSLERHFLDILDDGTCHSTLGYSNRTRNVLSVSPYCARLGVLRHQLMHVLGFGHEHQRPDRDQFLQLHQDNMAQPWLFSIQPRSTGLHDVDLPYDFKSVTHFGPYIGAKDPRLPVLTPRPEYAAGVKLGQTRSLSPTDTLRIQRLYGCTNRDTALRQEHRLWTPGSPQKQNVLFACDFEHGSCGMTSVRVAHDRDEKSYRDSMHDFVNDHDNKEVADEKRKGPGNGSKELSRLSTPRWSVVLGAAPDGPAAGSTNGLDPYLYVSNRLNTWAKSGQVRVQELRTRNKPHQPFLRSSRDQHRHERQYISSSNSEVGTSPQDGGLSPEVAALLLSAGGPGVSLVNASIFTKTFRVDHPGGKICVEVQVYQTDNYGGLALVLHSAPDTRPGTGPKVEGVQEEARAEMKETEVEVEQLHGIVLESWTWTAVTAHVRRGRSYRLELRATVGGGSVAVDDLYVFDGECL